MAKFLIKIQKGRRITIPAEIRKTLGLKIGDFLEFKATDESILLIPQKNYLQDTGKQSETLTAIQLDAQKAGLDKMTDDEISAEITAYRRSKTKK